MKAPSPVPIRLMCWSVSMCHGGASSGRKILLKGTARSHGLIVVTLGNFFPPSVLRSAFTGVLLQLPPPFSTQPDKAPRQLKITHHWEPHKLVLAYYCSNLFSYSMPGKWKLICVLATWNISNCALLTKVQATGLTNACNVTAMTHDDKFLLYTLYFAGMDLKHSPKITERRLTLCNCRDTFTYKERISDCPSCTGQRKKWWLSEMHSFTLMLQYKNRATTDNW